MLNFLVTFIPRAIMQGIPLLYGSTGEILTEKSGNLNLGIPGIMYMGAISSVIGAFYYETFTPKGMMNPLLAVLIPLVCCLIGSLLTGLLYCFLTVSLRANQNVTGLAITTFGVGFGNFFGGSLIKLSIAIVASYILKRTRTGLHLRAVGESPATADAAGINVVKYKYVATCVGSMIAGLGGLYYVLDYSNGIWSHNAFGDRGWLAIALVIFTIWRPSVSILASILFGGLYILYLYIPTGTEMAIKEIYKMFPYIITLLVLIIVSLRKKREDQPPMSLGLPYFREER